MRAHPWPCWPGPPCYPLITVNEDALAAAYAEPDPEPECSRCGTPLDREQMRRQPAMRYCSVQCRQRAQSRRNRLRARAYARSAAGRARPTPEQARSIVAEMRRALALAEYEATGVAPDADASAPSR